MKVSDFDLNKIKKNIIKNNINNQMFNVNNFNVYFDKLKKNDNIKLLDKNNMIDAIKSRI